MISCINLFRKDPTISDSEFDVFLHDVYAPLCLQIPELESFEFDRVTAKERGDASSEAILADAFTIERYVDLDAYEEARRSNAYAAVLRERVNAVMYEETYVCLENVSIPLRVEDGCQKKMTLLGRTVPDVSFEDFTREWFVVHSGCMAKMPTDIFYGYNQHLIIDRMINGRHVTHDRLPFDGILELFFSEASEVANAFKTIPEGQATVAHRKEFMSSVNPFLVDFAVVK